MVVDLEINNSIKDLFQIQYSIITALTSLKIFKKYKIKLLSFKRHYQVMTKIFPLILIKKFKILINLKFIKTKIYLFKKTLTHKTNKIFFHQIF
jgi:hypothetical protein